MIINMRIAVEFLKKNSSFKKNSHNHEIYENPAHESKL